MFDKLENRNFWAWKACLFDKKGWYDQHCMFSLLYKQRSGNFGCIFASFYPIFFNKNAFIIIDSFQEPWSFAVVRLLSGLSQGFWSYSISNNYK